MERGWPRVWAADGPHAGYPFSVAATFTLFFARGCDIHAKRAGPRQPGAAQGSADGSEAQKWERPTQHSPGARTAGTESGGAEAVV
jgi:hypothetical protein